MASFPIGGDVLHQAVEASGKIAGLAAPYIQRAVRQLYGHNTEDAQICPGETDCEKWESAAPKRTHAAKEKAVCHKCPMFPTKTNEGRAEHEALVELVNRAIKIRREYKAGYPRAEGRMAHIEFQTYLILSDGCEWYDLEHKANLEGYRKAGFGLKAG